MYIPISIAAKGCTVLQEINSNIIVDCGSTCSYPQQQDSSTKHQVHVSIVQVLTAYLSIIVPKTM